MKYDDLRSFLAALEPQGELKRITKPIDPYLEMTEVCDRTLRAAGPALLFEYPANHDIPVLANLFGTPRRVALAMGADSTDALREIGRLLAFLKAPDPPKGMRDAWKSLPIFKRVLDMAPRTVKSAPWHAVTLEGGDVDLGRFPIQTCWPGRRRAPHHLGAGHHPRTVARAHQPRDLPPAGHRAEPGHHALARPPRRRPRLPAMATRAPRRAVPGLRRARSGPRDDARSGHSGPRLALGIRVRRTAARLPHRAGRRRSQRATGAGQCRDRARRTYRARRRRARGSPSAITPATTTKWSASRCSPSRAFTTARRRSTTAPTPVVRPTSRRCSASR